MSPATASCLIMATASLALWVRGQATRCHSTHTGTRCTLGAGHTVATPHRYGDRSWWDWETTTPRSLP